MGAKPSAPKVALSRDRVFLVTGGNTGLGYEAAKYIAMMGASVIIACRSQERAMAAIEKMRKEFSELKAAGVEGISQEDDLAIEFMQLDLSSLQSTMDFITAFKATGRPLHVLLCNAGIAGIPREITEDGYEKMFQVNYLGHFLIVAHLLPIMKKSGEDCRIVSTSSMAHKFCSFDLATVQADNPRDYSRFGFYGRSKLYQIQHMSSLSRRLKGSDVTVTCLHPGAVATEIGRYSTDSRLFRVLGGLVKALGMLKTSERGGITLIDAAINPQWKGVSDVYFSDCKPASVTSDARNVNHQEALWNYTVKCLQDKGYLTDEVIQDLEGQGQTENKE